MTCKNNPDIGIVVIGRNEGLRLQRCLASIPPTTTVVYVDSGSTDNSVELARQTNADVLELDMLRPFTAARARNAGFNRLISGESQIIFVQFIDGDCELCQTWLDSASAFLRAHDRVAAVFGRLRERHPESSIYNRLCDSEWDGEPGETSRFGGIVMLRAAALTAADGFREDIIAGEEPELGIRLRREGWQLWRLRDDMAIHDAAMLHFWQWWRRNMRSGYAFATGAYLHGFSPERHWLWESVRAWLWGVALPLCCIFGSVVCGRWAHALWLIYPLQMVRLTVRTEGTIRDRTTKSVFQLLGRFPEVWGQVKFLSDRLSRREATLIEHK
jgi:glycosyltransferase involved in cell wall biosynthesis